jgi:hypothetical protein
MRNDIRRTVRLATLVALCGAALSAPQRAGAQTVDSVLGRMNAAEGRGDYVAAAREYERIYGLTGFDPGLLAGGAVSAARAGLDTLAVRYLRRAIREGYLNPRYFDFVESDSGLARIRKNPEWVAAVAEGKRRLASIDTTLAAELIALANDDQKTRQGIGEFIGKFGRASSQADSATKAMELADAPRVAKLQAIIAKRGWPGRSLVGDDGAHAAWLILQHAPADVQRRLFRTVSAAIRKGEGRLGDLALLEDRVLVNDGGAQKYGSSLRYATQGAGSQTLDPIMDEQCVDQRRAAMGLEPLADYLRRFNVKYEPVPQKCTSG